METTDQAMAGAGIPPQLTVRDLLVACWGEDAVNEAVGKSYNRKSYPNRDEPGIGLYECEDGRCFMAVVAHTSATHPGYPYLARIVAVEQRLPIPDTITSDTMWALRNAFNWLTQRNDLGLLMNPAINERYMNTPLESIAVPAELQRIVREKLQRMRDSATDYVPST